MIDLSLEYLGMKLSGPVVVSSTPLSESLDNIRRMEDAGAAAIVLTQLFEEQFVLESATLDEDLCVARIPLPSHSIIWCAESLIRITDALSSLSGVCRVFCAKRSRKPALSEAEGDLRLLFDEFRIHHTGAVPQLMCPCRSRATLPLVLCSGRPISVSRNASHSRN